MRHNIAKQLKLLIKESVLATLPPKPKKQVSLYGFLFEGGWDTAATQGTVINPSTVKVALRVIDHLISEFNDYLNNKGINPVRVGGPTGSSTYHDVDSEDKIYGDIDLQVVVPDVPELANKTTSQVQGYWNKLLDDYIKNANLDYVHPDSTPGHPIIKIGEDKWVQVDIMPHPERLEKWGKGRVTPERGVKGLLFGNMFSVLGELINMSIQHSGVQYKLRDKVKQPFARTMKNYDLITLTTDIDNFVKDIFDHEFQEITGKDPSSAKVDGRLTQNPGLNTEEVKISSLVNAVKGLAASFAMNNMYGKGDLSTYHSPEDFLEAFLQAYEGKAIKDITSTKRDKAETPEAIARAAADKEKVESGLKMVKGLFGQQ